MSAGTAFNHPASATAGAGDWPRDAASTHIDNGTSIVRISPVEVWPAARNTTNGVNLRAGNSANLQEAIRLRKDSIGLAVAPASKEGARMSKLEDQLDERQVVREIIATHEHTIVSDQAIHL